LEFLEICFGSDIKIPGIYRSRNAQSPLNNPRATTRAVVPGSAAAKAGIRPTRRESSGRVRLGDVITAIDGKKVESPNELFILLENYKVGEVVNISLLRDGKAFQTKVTLEAVQ
jgi:S1-C subfamily serine protease